MLIAEIASAPLSSQALANGLISCTFGESLTINGLFLITFLHADTTWLTASGLDENEREETYKKLVSYFDKIKDEKIKDFLNKFFEEHKEKIKISPAAKVMHHNYIGGLMVHTIECVDFAEKNLELFTLKLSRDIVLAACILHDIGKIFEYTVNMETGLIDYDENFRNEWISHSQYGFSVCMMHGFKRIAKMIAAHHGREEWGAIIDLDGKDLEPELYFLHFMDNLSAKFGRINVAMIERGLHWQN